MPRMSRILGVLMVISCGHSEPKPPAPVTQPVQSSNMAKPDADPAPCDVVTKHMVKLSPVTDPQVFVEILERHCRTDLWSLEARRCYLTSNSFEEAVPCETKLSSAQFKALKDEVEKRGATVVRPKPTP
jgi:hypothetical protein